MKPKTDDKGVRRAEFSAADVKLWRRFSDSVVELEIIYRGQDVAKDIATFSRMLTELYRFLAAGTEAAGPAAEPEDPDGE